MKKLTKKYKIVYEGYNMILPLTEQGDDAEVFPSVNAMGAEFDTYEEAKAYIDEHCLTYQEPNFDAPNGME